MTRTNVGFFLLLIACGFHARVIASPATQPGATAAAQTQPSANHFDNLPPERGVVLDLDRAWSPGGWGSNASVLMTNNFACDTSAGTAKFTTATPKGMRSWYTSFSLPIDIQRYPIIVADIRVKNAVTSNTFGYTWIDDGTGAMGGGVSISPTAPLDADKPVEFRYDARAKANHGPRFGAFVAYVYALDNAPAEFEIVDLRFEAPPDAPALKPSEDAPLNVTVVDEQNNPIAGATVIVDSERRNWARRATTDAHGSASVKPLVNEDNRHMLRVEAPGKLPVILQPGQFGAPAHVVMQRGQYYGGRVVGNDGRPVALARIGLSQENNPYPRCYTLTDARGYWRSSIMPAAADLTSEIVPPDSNPQASPQMYLPLATAAFNADTLQELDRLLAGKSATRAVDSTGLTVIYPVEGKPVRGKLFGIADGAVTLQPVDADKTSIPLEDVDYLSLAPEPPTPDPANTQPRGTFVINVATAAAPPPPSTTRPADLTWKVMMIGGDCLKGSLGGWSGGKLTLNGTPADVIAVPDSRINAIWRNDDALISQANAVKPAAADQDVAFVQENDHVESVAGSASGVDGDALIFRYENQPRRIALTRLVGLILAAAAPAKDAPFVQCVRLGDDQSLSGRWTGLDSKTLTLRTAWDQEIKLPLNQVIFIRNRNGRLVSLSDLEPAKAEETPYFDRVIHYRRDQVLSGVPLRVGDRTFEKGLAVHSRCVLTYDLGGKFVKFLCIAGFQQPEGRMGRVAVRVLGDEKVLFNQTDARGDQPPDELDLNVTGLRTLVLEVDFGRDQDVGDRFVWANARLLRNAAK